MFVSFFSSFFVKKEKCVILLPCNSPRNAAKKMAKLISGAEVLQFRANFPPHETPPKSEALATKISDSVKTFVESDLLKNKSADSLVLLIESDDWVNRFGLRKGVIKSIVHTVETTTGFSTTVVVSSSKIYSDVSPVENHVFDLSRTMLSRDRDAASSLF